MGTERQGLMKFAFRLLASRADAEDAVQDTYLRALAAFPDSVAPQPAWLYTVLRNIAIDRLRRKQLETEHAMAELASDPLPQIPIEIQSECKAALRHLLRRVSSAEAAAILLRDVFEFGYEDLARIIDKSEAAARQFLHRARTRAWSTEWGTDVDEVTIALYWHAIEARDPGPLMRLLQTTIAAAPPTAGSAVRRCSARSASILVQVNGRYAVALMLDGIVLCIVPVGTEATTSL